MPLREKAARLLDELRSRDGEATVSELEEEMDHGEIIRPAEQLAEDGIIEIEEETKTVYSLTPTGDDAYINGLPEKRLLKLIEDGSEDMDWLRQEINAFNIAIGQCRKHDWATITGDDGLKEVQITDDGKQKLDEGFEAEEALGSVHDTGTYSDQTVLDHLLDRGLIEGQEQTRRTLRIIEQEGETVDTAIGDDDEIGKLSPEVIRDELWKEKEIRPYNVDAPVNVRRPGKKHPYRQYLDEVRKRLLSMGFQEAKTDLVEMEFWNFDVLFQAQDHPAREIHDKFELEDPSHGDLMQDEIVRAVRKMHEKGEPLSSKGWRYEWSKEKASKLMLRSQTTATTIRYLARGLESPAKVFAIDRNFRYDEIDQTHFVEFYQAEGIVKAPDLSLRDLFGYLKVFGEEIAGAEKIRFRPNYFPFTEPSVELDAYHPELGWIEMGGAGLFRPEVRTPLDVDEPVIAWGMGIDRLAMFKLDIDDIRKLVFPQDLDYLRKSPAVYL